MKTCPGTGYGGGGFKVHRKGKKRRIARLGMDKKKQKKSPFLPRFFEKENPPTVLMTKQKRKRPGHILSERREGKKGGKESVSREF